MWRWLHVCAPDVEAGSALGPARYLATPIDNVANGGSWKNTMLLHNVYMEQKYSTQITL